MPLRSYFEQSVEVVANLPGDVQSNPDSFGVLVKCATYLFQKLTEVLFLIILHPNSIVFDLEKNELLVFELASNLYLSLRVGVLQGVLKENCQNLLDSLLVRSNYMIIIFESFVNLMYVYMFALGLVALPLDCILHTFFDVEFVNQLLEIFVSET